MANDHDNQRVNENRQNSRYNREAKEINVDGLNTEFAEENNADYLRNKNAQNNHDC